MLTSLLLDSNSILSIAPLSTLVSLTSLEVHFNRLESLTGLEGLSNLGYLQAQGNRLTDLSPVVDNPDFADGDRIVIWSNEFVCTSTDAQVAALTDRFVSVEGYECD
jgi:hypothetical protein